MIDFYTVYVHLMMGRKSSACAIFSHCAFRELFMFNAKMEMGVEV